MTFTTLTIEPKTEASILLYHRAYLASSDGFNMLSGPWSPRKPQATISLFYKLYKRFNLTLKSLMLHLFPFL